MKHPDAFHTGFLILFTALLAMPGCSHIEDKLKFLNPDKGGPEAPRVVASTPFPGQKGVAQDQPITIQFNKDIDQQKCIGAFSLQPSVPGVFDVMGSVMRFTPSKRFQLGETYVMTLGRTCEDKDGRDLAEVFNASFSVGAELDPPSISSAQGLRTATGCLSTDPLQTIADFTSNTYQGTGYCDSSPVVVNFSEAMDRGTVERNFVITPSIVGAFIWNAAGSQLTFRPQDTLANGVTYVVTVGDGGTDLAGNALIKIYTFSFTVGNESERPRIASVDGLVANPDCLPANATSALVLFPTFGLRNVQGVCSSVVSGSVNSPVIINFTEDMDTASTDSAFSVFPMMNGVKSWSASPTCGQTQGTCTANRSRLTFTPIEPWQNATTYTVTMQGEARDSSGNLLGAAVGASSSSQSFSFTVGNDYTPPTVIALEGDVVGDCDADAESPLPNLAINVCNQVTQQRLRIRFSEAMDPAITQTAFSIEPYVAGSLDWTAGNTELNFLPSTNLDLNTQYHITIGTTAADPAGNKLAASFIRYFTTGNGGPVDHIPPTVTDVRSDILAILPPTNCDGNASESIMAGFATGICTDNGGTGQNALIEVQFSEPMDQAMTAAAFSLSPPVSGIVTVAGSVLTFRATQALDPDRQYTINVGTGAADLAQNRLSSALVLYFQTTATGGYPGVTQALVGTGAPPCTGGALLNFASATISNACQQGNAIHLLFTEPMNASITQSAFSMSPYMTGTYSWPTSQELVFTPDQPMDYGKRYTVSLSTSARDAQGQAPSSPFSASFVVGALDSVPPSVTSVTMERSGDGDACSSPPDDITPAAGSLTTNVCRSVPIDIQFSEAMDQSTTTSAISVSLATVSMSWIAPNILRIIPVGTGFDSNSTHSLTVSSSATDLAGNRLPAAFVVSFQAQDTSPHVIAIGTEDQATCVDGTNMAGCWWSSPAAIGSATSYWYYGQDSACGRGYVGDTIGNQDNVRIIFDQPMDPAMIVSGGAISVSQIGGGTSFTISHALWSAGNTVLTMALKSSAYTGVHGCSTPSFDVGPTASVIPNYPLFVLQVDTTAESLAGDRLSKTFTFSFQGK